MPPQRQPSGGGAPTGSARGTRRGPSSVQQARLGPMSAHSSPRSRGDGAGHPIAGAIGPDFARQAQAPDTRSTRKEQAPSWRADDRT
jgi:hypothetical protein